MKLFNTLTQSLEDFVPIENTVRLYVCGVTPYDTTHLGHAFTYVTFDNLQRYLEFLGYGVKYVQNVTDIDDDILRKARELNMRWDELGNRETERFLNDMDALNVRRPAVYARATEETPMMIQVIEKLIQDDLAYVVDGNVYFSIKQDPDFGIMAHSVGLNNYQAMLAIANDRGNFPEDKRKHDPLDFVLWQAKQPGEPSWPSPWGDGRPGWHIECSAMSMKYLGEQIDIHGGGEDLAFPHHTCEIAQSEHYSGKAPFSRVWMHTGMVYQDGEKMSKSLGNLTLVSNLLKEYSPNAIRVMLADHHYRYPWECFPADLESANHQVQLFEQVKEIVGSQSGEDQMLRDRFTAAMNNDLNTPEALLLLRLASEDVLTNKKVGTGAEILNLVKILGIQL
jgi:L-cysteine:1D-myo-inositol 2-amino-2-deoxy-alpha-D-glucopyranoside ligase